MNKFLYVLLAWIVVLFIANKLLARRKPKTVKILVQRNGKAAEVDAVVVQGSKRANNSSVADSDAVDRALLQIVGGDKLIIPFC